MPFGLTIGTERATALQVPFTGSYRRPLLTYSPQQAIQDELTKRGYSPDAGTLFYDRLCTLSYHSIDLVMAEYITIMVINNKTSGMLSLNASVVLLLNPHVAQITSELEDCMSFQAILEVSNTDFSLIQ